MACRFAQGYLLLIFAMSAGLPAVAEDSCAAFTSWLDQVETLQSGAGVNAPDVRIGPEKPVCSQSLAMSGVRSIHCAWGFPYRAAEARAGFEAVSTALEQCYVARAQPELKQSVNHPDSYDLREYGSEDTRISVSLKDKGALQQSFVFLRAERRPE